MVCCCNTLLFDGSCFDKKKELIATCFDTVNNTIARCFEGRVDGIAVNVKFETVNTVANNSNISVTECYTSSSVCPAAKLDPIYPSWIFFFCGLVFVAASALLFLRLITKFRSISDISERGAEKETNGEEGARETSTEDSEEWGCFRQLFCYNSDSKAVDDHDHIGIRQKDESGGSHLRRFVRHFRQTNRSFAMRSFRTFGVELMVLGGITTNYQATLWLVGVYQMVYFCFVLYRSYRMVPPKEVHGRKKEKTEGHRRLSFQKAAIHLANPVFVEADDEEDEDIKGNEKLILNPSDIYDDISAPIMRVSLLFFCQLCLLAVYLYAIYIRGSPNFTTRNPYGFFIMGVLVQICYQETKDRHPSLYMARKKRYWRKSWRALNKKGEVTFQTKTKDKETVPRWSLAARIFMSSLINCQGTSMLMFLLPVHLSHSEDGIAFILDATAAYIIVELDDVIDHEDDEIKLISSNSDKTTTEIQNGNDDTAPQTQFDEDDEQEDNEDNQNSFNAGVSMSKDEIRRLIHSIMEESRVEAKGDEETASLLAPKETQSVMEDTLVEPKDNEETASLLDSKEPSDLEA